MLHHPGGRTKGNRARGLPWFRDADNLTYLCQSMSEGQHRLGRAGRLL